MKRNPGKQEIEVIKNAFGENRKIIGFAPKEMTNISEDAYTSGDIFITEEGELITLEYQMKDFDEEELVKYVELAEELYEINAVHISIYILCPTSIKILTDECTIKSNANFSIKLACFNGNPHQEILNHIKQKVERNIKLSNEDINMLSLIPMISPQEYRHELRVECFRLLNKSRR